MEALIVALPGFLFSAISLVPMLIGFLCAAFFLKENLHNAYLCNLVGSIAGGVALLWLFWGTYFGDYLSSSSTAGLIFVFAPVYAAIPQAIAFGVCVALIREAETISQFERYLMLIPVLILAVLLFGMIRLAVVDHAASAATSGQGSPFHSVGFIPCMTYAVEVRGQVLPFAHSCTIPMNINNKHREASHVQTLTPGVRGSGVSHHFTRGSARGYL